MVLSHSGLLSVTATHATALDTYLYWRRRSTRRGIFIPLLGHKGGENVAARDQNYSATLQTGASSMVVTVSLSHIFLSCRSADFLCIYLLG